MSGLAPFRCILADPAWVFKTYSPKGMDRSAENHYRCTPLEVMSELPVDQVADKDSVLFMWATNPMLDQAFVLAAKWQFSYLSKLEWIKWRDGRRQMITGYRFRGNTESLLLFKRRGGSPFCPAPGDRKIGSIMAPSDRHSVKPVEQWDYIEQYPGPYLELFAREERSGWTALGDEIDGRDLHDSLTDLASQIVWPGKTPLPRLAALETRLRRQVFHRKTLTQSIADGTQLEWYQAAAAHYAYNG